MNQGRYEEAKAHLVEALTAFKKTGGGVNATECSRLACLVRR